MATTLESWIAEVQLDTEKTGDLTQLSLVHMAGQAEREIHTVRFNGAKKWTSKELGELFLKKARVHSEELSGPQMFVILAFWGGRVEPEARKPIRIQGDASMTGQLETEGPTGTGLVQQAMRHMEAIMALSVRQTSILFDAQNQTIQHQTVQLNNARNENVAAFNAIKEMLMEKATDQHRHRMEELNYLRSSETRRNLMKLAPAFLNRLSGKEIVPEGTSDTAILAGMAEHLMQSPQAQKAMLDLAQSGSFPPLLTGMLADRMEKLMRERRIERESDEQIIRSGVDAEADAAGEMQ